MAAYNMGYAGLSRAIRKFNSNDFWELTRYEAGIPWETTLYVPKILAIALVMNNRRAFGLADVEPDPPVSFDTLLVPSAQPLSDVAKASGVALAEVERLNPTYPLGRTPPTPGATRKWPVYLPKGRGSRAGAALATASTAELQAYAVRFGDTLESIAAATGATERALANLNALAANERLAADTILLVPRVEASETRTREPEVIVVPPRHFQYPTRRRVFYTTLAGDTLGEIAAAFGVSDAEVFTWNALDSSARLQPGMVLQLFVAKDKKLERARHTAEADARVLISGSPEFHDYFEGLKGNRRLVVTARSGDSLA
jgi:membrane-bound lytic murein transglycosylase D